jgi:membrane dipeptidase
MCGPRLLLYTLSVTPHILSFAKLIFLLVLISGITVAQQKPTPQQVHNSAIVVDTHADTPMRFLHEGYDLAGPRGNGYMDLKSIKQGNLGAQFFSIFLYPDEVPPNQYAHRAMDIIDTVYEQVRRHPDAMEMAYTVADIRRIRSAPNPKLATLMGIEGGHCIEDDLRVLRNFYRLGVRYMTLTWSNTNDWADSSGDINDPKVKHHDGLTDFGKQVVLEMNRLGMMVDISHVADKTFWDAIAVTKAPVIASHSSARALTDAPRNMTDDMLKAVAKNGGVVQVNFFSAFVDENFRKQYGAMSAERNAALKAVLEKYKNADEKTRFTEYQKEQAVWAAKVPRPPLKSLIDHIDHVAKVAGIDHVGIGSDFDGIDSSPQGMDSTADLPKITEALMQRGYSADDCRKILGGNLLRVMSDVERIAKQLQQQLPEPQ